jgi:hypothetical protein
MRKGPHEIEKFTRERRLSPSGDPRSNGKMY